MSLGQPPRTSAQKVKVAIKRSIGLSGVKDVKVLTGPARGVSMRLDFSGHTPMYLGMFEWELHRFFKEALRDAQLVFDVGGYVGYDALMFANGSGGSVITFEPDSAQAAILDANLVQNPELAARITINPNFVTAQDSAGTTTIDSISASAGVPDFIKIDIDGGEAAALRGATRTLTERRPHVMVETHSLALERECGAFLVLRLQADHQA